MSSEDTIHIETREIEQTIGFGNLIGSLLMAGDVVALMGQLGAGKTYLTKGIAEGLGIRDRDEVTSPTFVIVKPYTGRLPIYHFDAYRLKSPEEMEELDCVGFFWGKGVSIVEWADKVIECLPDDFIRITIEPTGRTTRNIHISSTGERYRDFMEKIKEKVKCLV